MIPAPIISAVAVTLEAYYTRKQFENLFLHSRTSVESPGGNKRDTVTYWLREINRREAKRSLDILGRLLEDFMEREVLDGSEHDFDRDQLHELLEKHGLRYASGGKIIRKNPPSTATVTVEKLLCEKNFPAVQDEFNRATDKVESEPREAASAAANILEAICKEYIVQHPHLQMPAKQDLSKVFDVVRKDLGFDPSALEDDDLKAILSGLIAIVGGIAALRTHASSAHAQATSKRRYRLGARHARLAVGAAHAVVAFILETWAEREK